VSDRTVGGGSPAETSPSEPAPPKEPAGDDVKQLSPFEEPDLESITASIDPPDTIV
jgi:hypothetical protein